MDKEEILDVLKVMGFGTFTPVRTTDNNGFNENYSCMPVDSFFDEESQECLLGEDWSFVEIQDANTENVDMNVWAQEFDSEESIGSLKDSLQNNQIKIASFRSEKYGNMDIMLWE